MPGTTPEELFGDMGWARRLARSLVGDPGAAEDLTQEALVAAWRRPPGAGPPPRSWLAVVMRNLARQRARSEAGRRAREERASIGEALPSAEELALRMERQRLLAEAVVRLDEPYRSTVILRYGEDLAPAEIARRQGLPGGTVRRRLKVGLDRLRADLDRRFDGDRTAWTAALVPLLAPPRVVAGGGLTAMLGGGGLVMKKLALLALLAVVVAVGFLAVMSEDPGDVTTLAAGGGDGAAAAPVGPPTAAGPDAPAQSVEARGTDVRAPLGRARPPRGEVVLTGRVVWPSGCARDETLTVFALSQSTTYADFVGLVQQGGEAPEEASPPAVLATAPVDDGGRFTVRLPAEAALDAGDRAHLMASGRHLYLDETVEVPAGVAHGDGSREPVLVLESGAWIRGRLIAPEGARLAGVPVALSAQGGELQPTVAILELLHTAVTTADASGRFEFCGVPAGFEYALIARPGDLAAGRAILPVAAPCGEHDLVLPLEVGAAVRGRVVDAAGEPVEGARVEAMLPGSWFGLDDPRVREVRSDHEGRFVLEAAPLGEVYLRARKAGHLESSRMRVDLAATGAEGVELELGRGLSIGGSVAWSDGRPARAVVVRADFDRAHFAGTSVFNAARGAAAEARTDVEGCFLFTGLGAGPFTVRCEATPPGASDTVVHGARRDGVAPGGESGTSDVELVLRPPLGVRGVVLDELGQPLPRFRVHAMRVVEGAFGEMSLDRHRRTFEAADGAFFLGGLEEGRWRLYAEAEHHVGSAAVGVVLPAPPELTITLDTVRSAVVEGRVLAPDGGPASRAEVHVDVGLPAWLAAVGAEPHRRPVAAEDGTFRIEGLVPGTVELYATAADTARGPGAIVELSAGVTLSGVELTLREGGTLTGEVFGDDGAPAVGRVIHLENTDTADTLFGRADRDGRFRFDHLLPGPWLVAAVDAGASPESTEDGVAWAEIMSTMRLEQVRIADGQRVHVVLGAPVSEPVRVHGRVTRGGAAHAGVQVSFFPATGGPLEALKLAVTDASGAYEVVVGEPGTYSVSVAVVPGEAEGSTIDWVRDVPATGAHRLDLALPTARLSGRVFGPGGEPLENARVDVYGDGREHTAEYHQGAYRALRTDAEGHYDCDGLRAGTFAVAAGGADPERDPSPARVTLAEVEIADGEWKRGVDVHLPAPGAVRVLVVDAEGKPARRATVFARDEAGSIVDPLSAVTADRKGRALYDGLAPGTYTFAARVGRGASVESEPVVVRAGEESNVTLELGPATRLRVHLEDAQGAPLCGWFQVLDAEGREVGSVYAEQQLFADFLAGAFSPSSPLFGPLPPGEYLVEAEVFDGRSASRRIVLAGASEREVRLVAR